MSESTCVVILAAGKGTRMKSELPKVLHTVQARPMIAWALDAARAVQPERIVVVVGHGAEQVRGVLGPDVQSVVQQPQLGTGHAMQVALPALADRTGDVLVSYGDMPLLTGATLASIRDGRRQRGAAASVLTAIMDPPPAYGRIVRDAAGHFEGIVEDRDCSPAQKLLTEVNIAVYCFALGPLREALARLRPDNAQGEYYLTDVLAHLRQAGHDVVTVASKDREELLGVNDLEGLRQVEQILAQRGGGLKA
ncbi:MAG: NTP transferase domain-containing protein [Pseudomonadota bacterium]